jgi:hypothetical protein
MENADHQGEELSNFLLNQMSIPVFLLCARKGKHTKCVLYD